MEDWGVIFFLLHPRREGRPTTRHGRTYLREGPFRTDIYATLPVLAEIFALFCRI